MATSLFFVHVMKTGGTSLVNTMRRSVGDGVSFPDDELPVAAVAQKSITTTLLGTDDAYRASRRFYAVHQPAWVAFEVPPEPTVRVTVLRDPVDRTISHLRQIAHSVDAGDALESLYDDPGWRTRLADYQTQMLHAQARPPDPPPGPAIDPDDLSDAEKKALIRGLQQELSTAIRQPVDVSAAMVADAKRTLDRFDVVGTTDEIDAFTQRVSAAVGLPIEPPPHANRTRNPAEISISLRRKIEDDCRHDMELFEYARSLQG